MAIRRVVRLRIEVPADVDVVPMIVRAPSPTTINTPGALNTGGLAPPVSPKALRLDLKTAKAAEWLNAPGFRADNCCCVRGFIG